MKSSTIDPRTARSLMAMATRALRHAVAGCSGFKVGAALLASDGTVHTGCNIENPSLMLTVCAERVALQKALSEGKRKFKAIAVVSEIKNPCYPCGACRQVLAEFTPGIEVIVKTPKGPVTHLINELLPLSFTR